MHVLISYAQEATASLWRHRVRSILTMLGMIIGSASIIAVFGISRAAATGISSTFSSFGQAPVFIAVDTSQDEPARAAIQYRDIATVTEALGDAAASVQAAWQRMYQVSSPSTHDFETVTTDGAFHTDSLIMAEGHEFTQEEVDGAQRVSVISADVAHKYLGEEPWVGKFLRIKGSRYEVTGVFQAVRASFFSQLTSGVIAVPYTTFYSDFAPGDLDGLVIYPTNPGAGDTVGKAAMAALQHVHGDRAKYTVENAQTDLHAFDTALNIVAVALSAIGGVALIVAGIGIMNIMLVSVTERTREIGIRKAIGANRSNIVLQFLMEAVALAIAGGGIGMVFGLLATVGAVSLLSKQLGEMIVPYLLIVCIALSFSIGVGVIFGTYPAMRAATLDPIEALRS